MGIFDAVTIFHRESIFSTSHGPGPFICTAHLNFATIWNGDNEFFYIACKMCIFAVSNVAIFLSTPLATMGTIGDIIWIRFCGSYNVWWWLVEPFQISMFQLVVLGSPGMSSVPPPYCLNVPTVLFAPTTWFDPCHLFSHDFHRLAIRFMMDMGYYTFIYEDTDQHGRQLQLIRPLFCIFVHIYPHSSTREGVV